MPRQTPGQYQCFGNNAIQVCSVLHVLELVGNCPSTAHCAYINNIPYGVVNGFLSTRRLNWRSRGGEKAGGSQHDSNILEPFGLGEGGLVSFGSAQIGHSLGCGKLSLIGYIGDRSKA